MPTSLKMRERIARAVSARMEAGAADLEATRRCAAFLALPTNADLGLKLAWESADHLWRWAGDTATDWNHYSKRAILSGILIPALTMRWFDGQRGGRGLRRRPHRERHGLREVEGRQGFRRAAAEGHRGAEPDAVRGEDGHG